LDLGTLKKLRTVSRIWNEEALRAIHSRYEAPIRLNFEPIDAPGGRKLLQELFNLIDHSCSPSLYFKNFDVSYFALVEPAAQDLLELYGSSLKKLRIRRNVFSTPTAYERRTDEDGEYEDDPALLVGETLWDILTNVCTGLEEVSFHIPFFFEDTDELGLGVTEVSSPLIKPFDVGFPQSLQLRSIEIDGSSLFTHQEFFRELIGSCPQLVKLRLITRGGGYDATPSFINWLSENPTITRKLREFHWEGEENRDRRTTGSPMLVEIAKLSFSSLLKHLTIGGVMLPLHDPTQFPYFQWILNVVAPHLRSLRLPHCYGSSFLRENEELQLSADMPLLQSLKTDYNSFGLSFWALYSRLPGLTRIEIGKDNDLHPEISLESYFKKFSTQEDFPVNLNLRTLIILGKNLKTPKLLEKFAAKFPNLEHISVRVRSFGLGIAGSLLMGYTDWHHQGVWLTGIFGCLSKAVHLKTIEITMEHGPGLNGIFQTFSLFRNFPSKPVFII
jgi:hypothetical protein